MNASLELFRAVAVCDASTVSRVIGAQPELARAKNDDTLSILQFARYMQDERILEALIAAGPELSLFEASQLDRTANVAAMLDRDPTLINARSADGFTALHLAAYYGSPNVVRLLLERGADTAAITTNFLENMPLHAAAAGRRTEECRLLLEHGADVNARQHGGHTPLHAAAQHGDRAMADLFVAHNADVAARNDDGKSPADIAASQGHIELAALLRAHEAVSGTA